MENHLRGLDYIPSLQALGPHSIHYRLDDYRVFLAPKQPIPKCSHETWPFGHLFLGSLPGSLHFLHPRGDHPPPWRHGRPGALPPARPPPVGRRRRSRCRRPGGDVLAQGGRDGARGTGADGRGCWGMHLI